MFKIAKTENNIFKLVRNTGKYSSRSKGYIEDASDELVFNKALPESIGVQSQYNITDEFKDLKIQGYDFAATKKAIENKSSKSIFERMKELSISGHISRYAGDPYLREDIEKVILQKALVINEFMERVTSKVDELEEHSTELLG